MLRRLRSHLTYANVTATLALFFALAGGSAYAINEWNSSNIQNETLLSEDVKNGTLKAEDYGVGSVSGARIQDNNVTTLDLADGAIFGNDVRDNSLTGSDLAPDSIISSRILDGQVATADIGNGAVTGAKVAFDSLTGSDIVESTLQGVKDGDSCGNSGATFFANARLCAGSDNVARNFYAAVAFCASLPGGTRLATLPEAVLLAENHDVPGVVDDFVPERFWTGDITAWGSPEYASGVFDVSVVDENGNIADRAYSSQAETVCVTIPD